MMKQIILLSAAALVMMSACVSNKLPKKDIALQLYSVQNIFKNFDSTIANIAGMGYTAVEAANFENGKFYGKTPEEYKAAIEKAGLRLLSSHIVKILTETELETKDFSESLAWWDDAITAHLAAGTKYIVMPWMGLSKSLADLQVYCDYYNAVGKKCKERGVSFGYHNHEYEYEKIEGVRMLDYMLEHTNPEYVFFELDVYWTVIGRQSPVAYFRKYPGRFLMLHIKDRTTLGESGMVGFDAIFKNTDVAGAKYIVVEVEPIDNAEECVKGSIDYLRAFPLVKSTYE
jgi:sugar phosphate isomerase/epimerase